MSLHTATIGPSMLPDLYEQVEQTIAEACRQGANTCEVAVSLEQGLPISVRQGEVETVEFNRDQGFDTTLYVDRRKGSTSISVTDEAVIREMVATALVIACHTSEDECAGSVGAALMARELPELDLYHPWSLSPEQAVERTPAREAAALVTDKRVTRADGTTLSTHQGCRIYGNSRGFIGGYVSARHSLSYTMIVESEGQMQRGYRYDVNHRDETLVSVESIGRHATECIASRLGVRPVQATEVSVLPAPEIAVGLFGHFPGAVSGDSLHHESSFLEGALDRRLLPEWLNIGERPYLVGVFGSTNFDSNDPTIYAKPFAENGELVFYVLGIHSGRKLGLLSTANTDGVHNLFVSHGDEDQAALIRWMGCDLLVVELMGQGVDLATGDYPRSAAGHWVEDGETQFPVQEAAIAANLRDLFRRIIAVGKDIERRGSPHTGSVLVGLMTVAGR